MKIYLDYSSTTPIAPKVLEAMYHFGRETFGNPSSPHQYGQKARFAIENARDRIAETLHCKSSEIVFTSGGTESNNLALAGILSAAGGDRKHIVTTAVEHPSVHDTLTHLEQSGCSVSRIAPDSSGTIRVRDISRAITDNTALVSVMDTNNETGIRHPVMEIAEYCHEQGILFHCDAVQSFGKFDIDLHTFKADLLSLSGHKIFAPKGIGVLFIREGTPRNSIFFGGSQETNRRAGTENTLGIVGLGAAVASLEPERSHKKVKTLQSYFEQRLTGELPFIQIIGDKVERSPYISNILFRGYDGSTILMNLDMAGIAVSVGSACSSGSIEPSRVLRAMGIPDTEAKGAVRFSFSHLTEKDELDQVIEHIHLILERIPGGHTYA